MAGKSNWQKSRDVCLIKSLLCSCFADMIILEQTDGPMAAGFHRHRVTFARVPQSSVSSTLLDSHLEEDDRVVLSIEPDLLSLARGVVMELTSTQVVIGVEERLDMQALLGRTRRVSMPVVWRLDKDDMLAGTGKMQTNIAHLFRANNAGGDYRRRELIVHLHPPRFEHERATGEVSIPEYLNPNQKAALEKAFTAKDYALILAPPGTGKRTSIAEIILGLVTRGQSVLLTSTTHAAVDEILLQLLDSGHRILRIGHVDKVGIRAVR